MCVKQECVYGFSFCDNDMTVRKQQQDEGESMAWEAGGGGSRTSPTRRREPCDSRPFLPSPLYTMRGLEKMILKSFPAPSFHDYGKNVQSNDVKKTVL